MLPRVGVDRERHGAADGHRGDVLRRDGQLDAQRVDAHDRRDLRPARDVVANRDQALGHDTVEGRPHHRVRQRLPRQRRARDGRGQRLILLQRAVAGGLVLPPGGFDLRLPQVELRSCDELLLEERAEAGEVGLREVVRGFGTGHFRHAVDVQAAPVRSDRAVRRTCATLASASSACASASVAAMRTSASPARTWIPRSTGRGDDPADGLGRDLGGVLGHERAARANEPRDRPLDRRPRLDPDGRRRVLSAAAAFADPLSAATGADDGESHRHARQDAPPQNRPPT